MANRVYAGTPADFALALGAETPLLDEAGDPIGSLTGWEVLIPTLATAFDVYDAGSTQYTDLVDSGGNSVSVITASDAWATAGQILTFTVNDAPDGDVYLVGTGGTPFTDPTFRLSPATDEIFDRLTAVESMSTADLADWSETPPTNGQVPVFDTGTGQWTPGSSPGGGVATVAGVAPIDGDVPLTRDDLGAADDAVVDSIASTYLYLHVGTSAGYPAVLPIGQPIYAGPVDPGPDTVGKLWLQPVSP